jgi:hypothetical protein
MKTLIIGWVMFALWIVAHVGATGLHINALYRIG